MSEIKSHIPTKDEFVDSLRHKLVLDAIEKAENAHHKYEQEKFKGKRDADWAAWYAKFIISHVNIFADIDPEILEKALIDCTTAIQFHRDYTWEEFTTSYLVHYILF